MELSSHPLVRQVIKGAFALKPPVKKTLTWEMEDLIKFLKAYALDENNLFAVSRHVAVLLLLASGRRVHDLTLLSLDNGAFEDKGDELVFWPIFGAKTDSATYRQSGWLLKSDRSIVNNRLDIVYWVKKYILVSGHRRTGTHNLFTTTRGTIKPASRTVIAGWIKTLFKEAGLSTSAGSLRAAVATHNWTSNQFSIDEILKRGNWQSKTTFFKHYFKEVRGPDVENANVLNRSFVSC